MPSFPVDNWFKAPKLPASKPPARKPAPSLPYPGYQTPAQIQAAARAQAQAGIQPSITTIHQLQADEQARATQRAQLIQSLYSQLAELQKGVAPATQQIYTTAANTQAGFAKGFSDGLQNALNGNSSAINQTLASIGAPAGQQNQSQAEAAGNVLYGLGGMLPATVLNREGAAFGSAAALLPGATLGRGILDVNQLLNASADTQKGYGEKIAELEAGLPADIQRITAGLNAAQAKLEATNYARKKDQRDFAFKVWQANTKLKTDAAKTSFDRWYKTQSLKMRADGQSFQQWATQQRLAIAQRAQQSTDAYRQARLGKPGQVFGSDKSGRYTYVPDGQGGYTLQQVTPPIQGAGPGGRKATAGQLKLAGQIANQSFKGYFADTTQPDTALGPQAVAQRLKAAGVTNPGQATQDDYAKAGIGYFHRSYQEAMKALLTAGVPLAAAQRALNQYWQRPGYDRDFTKNTWVPSAVDRPKVPYQQRAAGKAGAASSGYVNPFPAGTKQNRTDQGVDVQGPVGSHIGALGKGIVIYSGPAQGYGNLVIYQLTGPGPMKGRYIFVGHALPVVRQGAKLQPGQPVSQLVQVSGGNASNLAGWAEIGWASGAGGPLAGSRGHHGANTPEGHDFVRWLISLGILRNDYGADTQGQDYPIPVGG